MRNVHSWFIWIRCSHLSVRVKDQLPLDGDLWKDIKADESGWLIDQEANQRCIIITLIKRDARTLGNSFFSLFGCYGDTMMEHMFFFQVWIVACLHLVPGANGRWPVVISEQSW